MILRTPHTSRCADAAAAVVTRPAAIASFSAMLPTAG